MTRRWCWETKWEIQDLWVGLYWKIEEVPPPYRWHFYFCPFPCCLIHIWQELLP